jgi:type II secretory ATPase GspE/PulE/Tfp pilus assembly ATPase PilB-like protein
MVGEIRDLETADIAIKAAQTGHLVLDPDTNDSAATLMRLATGAFPRSTSPERDPHIAQRLAQAVHPMQATGRHPA